MARQRNIHATFKYLQARFSGNMPIVPEYSFDNNKQLQVRNAANTADVNVIGNDTSDVTQLGNPKGVNALALSISPLASPAAPTVTVLGTAGSTSWGYKIVAKSGNGTVLGTTAASLEGTTSTGNATLSATNFNTITWPAVPGAASYDIYRTTASGTPSSTGLIGNLAAQIISEQTIAPTFNDTGLTGDSSTAPTVNTTGTISLGGSAPYALGQESHNPLRKTVTFNLAANGSLATQQFFIADRAYTVTGITYGHKTAGTNGSAVTANITKDTSTAAPGAGNTLQSGTFNCKGTANVTQTATLTATAADLNLAVGDRLAIVFTGTLTTLAGVYATVTMTPASKSETAQYFVAANADLSTQTFFTAHRDMVITGVQAAWATPFAAAVTVDVTKDTSTNAPGAGTSILAATMDGTTAANTVLSPALAATAATLKMAAGDRLSIKYSATTTGTGVVLTVSFAPTYGRVQASCQLGPNAQQQVAQCFFVADRDYEVIELSEVHATAAGGAATIKISIDKGTTVPGGGADVAGGTLSFNLNATANTVQFGDSTGATLTTVPLRTRLLSAGDRLGITIASGAAQSLANVEVTASLVPW